MKDLIKRLTEPTHNSEGQTVAPSNLHRQAANAIQNLINTVHGLARANDHLTTEGKRMYEQLSAILREQQNAKTANNGSPADSDTKPGDAPISGTSVQQEGLGVSST